MFYSGFADEAGASIDVQIKATRELGWNHIELRNIDGINITDISDGKFDEVCSKLAHAGIKVNCFGSNIANYNKRPLVEEAFEKCVEELERAIPRMKKLGTKAIRGMSFGTLKGRPADDGELEEWILRKLNKLVQMCEEAGVMYLHENCANHFSQSYDHVARLVDRIKSPAFGLVFDTGNPPITDNKAGQEPYRKQTSWEFYSRFKEFIRHVHIKDCVFIEETGGTFPKARYTFPGEGEGEVPKIVKDLLDKGYKGGFSIEPHLAVVYHDPSVVSEGDIMYKNYIEYGKRFMRMVEGI